MDAKTKSTSIHNLAAFLDERIEDGVCRVDRSIFTDPDIFEMEMEKIWEGNWIYLAHESQIPNPHDFITLYMGRQPIILIRGGDGTVNAFINACAHRGVTLAREIKGNAPEFSCPFHGWCFDSSGKAVLILKEEGAGYPDSFCKENYSLTKVPKVGIHNGFIFGSLNADVLDLHEHLGPAATIIDMLANQGEQGMEVLKGSSTYTFTGNWKVQAENGVDGYHAYATHGNYISTTEHRRKLKGEDDSVKAIRLGGKKLNGNFLDLGHGHVVLWGDYPSPDDRPNIGQYDRYVELYGEEMAKWMALRFRNMLLYPNVFLMDQSSTQIRVFRPISVNETEVTIYGIAPVGEAPELRERRIRQWEDFFNASGMATPDDVMEFKQAQIGYQGTLAKWNDLSRGLKHIVPGGGVDADKLGIGDQIPMSGAALEDEGVMLAQHRWWLETLSR